MSVAHWSALVVAVVAAVVLVRIHRRHVASVRRDRAGLFAAAMAVLDEPRVRTRGLDFPVLYGGFEGRPVRVEAVVDALGIRTVPVLRLVVTVRDRLTGQPRLSVLSGETGQEFYAQHRGLARLRDPEWPAGASVASETVEVSREIAAAAVAAAEGDPAVKQVLVTDRGVRCVVRAGQSDVATYRVTRRVDLGGIRVPADLLRDAVTTATALCDRVARDLAVKAAAS